MERFVKRSLVPCTLVLALFAGCSSVENFLGGDRVDYRSGASKTTPLEVPPDLTQLSRDARFQPQGGGISASTYGQAAAAQQQSAAPSAQTVAPTAVGEIKLERDGTQRWLYVPLPPEQLWPQLRAFWQERGFALAVDSPETGTMETDWAENRARIPEGGVRALLGRVFDSLYSTSERDRFRTRVERSARGGSEVTITHRGMEEVYINQLQDQTKWQPRPMDPQLEAEFLSRLMAKLGARDEAAKLAAAPAVAPAPAASAPGSATTARARVVDGTTLQIDEGFDRAWRRVGAALDRSGFTVEDRDRSGGLFYVRYVDPSQIGKEEPGFFAKLFGGKDSTIGLARYRIALSRDGDARTLLKVQNAQGAPESGDAGQRIVSLLIDDLR
jgi:outer membrane protein assembly factor BamC